MKSTAINNINKKLKHLITISNSDAKFFKCKTLKLKNIFNNNFNKYILLLNNLNLHFGFVNLISRNVE